QHPRRIAFYIIPTVVICIQIRLHALSSDMAFHNIINEMLQDSSFPPERPEGERFDPPPIQLASVLDTREPDLKRPAGVPEPVISWRRNHSDALIAQRCIQIHVANSL